MRKLLAMFSFLLVLTFCCATASVTVLAEGENELSPYQTDAYERVTSANPSLSDKTKNILLSAAGVMDYEGLAARLSGDRAGIRSQYSVDTDLLDSLAAKYPVTIGAIMGVGTLYDATYNETTTMTVGLTQDGTAIEAKSRGAQAVVVYDTEGRYNASNLFNTVSLTKERIFSFTTVYSDAWSTVENYKGIELVYRGFLMIEVEGVTYTLYYDATGDVFGGKDAQYGAATSMLELCEFFTEKYVNEEGENPYEKHEFLRSIVVGTKYNDNFTVTANDLKDTSGVVYYPADDAAGTRETAVFKNGTHVTVTLKAAREGYYKIGLDANTLGGYVRYFYTKNTSLPNATSGGVLNGLQNDFRINLWNKTENTTLANAYAAYFKTLYGVDSFSLDDLESVRDLKYTYGEDKTSGYEAYRAVSSVSGDTYDGLTHVYLKEGDNTLELWLNTNGAGPAANGTAVDHDLSAIGIASITYTLDAAVNPDYKTVLAGVNATLIYGDPIETQVKQTVEGGNNSGRMIRKQGYKNTSSPNNLYAHGMSFNFTVPKTGYYDFAMKYSVPAGDGGWTYEILSGADSVKGGLIISNGKGNDTSTSSNYGDFGIVGLTAGETYTLRIFATAQSNYFNLAMATFSYVSEKKPAEALPETDFVFEVGDAGLTLNGGTYETNANGAAILKKGAKVEVKFTPEVSGIYEYRMRFSHNGIVYATDHGDRIVETIHVSGGTSGTRLGYTKAEGKTHPANVTETREFYHQYVPAGTSKTLTFTFGSMLDDTEIYLEAVEVSLYDVGDDAYIGEEMLYIADTKNFTYTPSTEGNTSGAGVVTTTFETANLGVYTYNQKFSVSGGTYRVFLLMSQGAQMSNLNMGVNFDGTVDATAGIATGSFKGGTTLDIDDARALYGLTDNDMSMQTASAAVRLVPFGTVDLSAGEHTFSVFNTTARLTVYAGLWLVRVPDHEVTVDFVDENGEKLFDSVTKLGATGDRYEIAVPKIEGYTASVSAVKGEFSGEETVTVTYKKQRFDLRVDYYLPNGQKAADTYTATCFYGDAYTIPSPTVEGYVPNIATVSGTVKTSLRIVVRYDVPTYTVTVNFVDAYGNAVAESKTVSGKYGTAYEVTAPDVDGYDYKSKTVVRDGFYGNETVNVIYGKSQYIFSADDITVQNADVQKLTAQDGTKSVFLSNKVENAKELTFTVRAAVAGVYRIDFLYNSLGYKVHYLLCDNLSTGAENRANCRFVHNDKSPEDSVKPADYAVTADMVSAGYTQKNGIYLYLKAGDNNLKLTTSGNASHLAIYEMKVALVHDASYDTNYETKSTNYVEFFKTKDESTGAAYQKDVLLRYGVKDGKKTYAVWKITVPTAGEYDLSAILYRHTCGFTVDNLGGSLDHDNVYDSITVGAIKGEIGGGSSSSAGYSSIGKIALVAGDNHLRFTIDSNNWVSFHRLFLTPVDMHTVTVDYVYEDGSEAAPSASGVYGVGDTYEFTPPVIAGYAAIPESVSGTVGNAPVKVTVTYKEAVTKVTLRAVSPKGEVICDDLGSVTVPTGTAYTMNVPSLDATYIVNDSVVSGVATTAWEQNHDIVIYRTVYTLGVSDFSADAGSERFDATDTTLATLAVKTGTNMTFTVNADVKGTYKIEVIWNHNGSWIDHAKFTNKTLNLRTSSYRRDNANETAAEASTFKVPTGRAYEAITDHYLQAGKNEFNFYSVVRKGYVGIAGIRFTLVTPQWEEDDVLVKYSEFTRANGALNHTNDGETNLRLSNNGAFAGTATVNVTIGKTGYYDVNALVGIDRSGSNTLYVDMTNEAGETNRVASFMGKGYHYGTWNVSTKETLLAGNVLLEAGTYTVTLSTENMYRVSIGDLRFSLREELDTVSGESGLYTVSLGGAPVKIDAAYYPGFTRKAVTFSYDDANATYDTVIAGLLREYGYTGTFMVPGSPALNMSIYEGHAVASHGMIHADSVKYDTSKANAEQAMTMAAFLSSIRQSKKHLEGLNLSQTANIGGEVLSFAVPMSSGFRFNVTLGNEGNDYRGDALCEALATEFNTAAASVGAVGGYTAEDFKSVNDQDAFVMYMNLLGFTVSREISGGYSIRSGDLFSLDGDFLFWQPSLHQTKLKSSSATEYVNAYASAYAALPDNMKMTCFFIWGHPTEIDSSMIEGGTAQGVNNNNVTATDLIGFLETFSGDGYFKGSMEEVALHYYAARNLRFEGDVIYNDADVAVYLVIDDGEAREIMIAPHSSWKYTASGDPIDISGFETEIAEYYGNASAAVSTTFDDGQYESLAYASELGETYGVRMTAFIIPNYHNTSRVPASGEEREDWIAAWQALVALGWVDVGNHSNHHYGNQMYIRPLNDTTTAVGGENFETEIKVAHGILTEWFPGSRIITFATPGANIGEDCVRALAEYGYYYNRIGGAEINDPYSDDFDPYRVKSYQVMNGTTAAFLNAKVDEAVANGGWFVSLFHYIVDENGEKYWPDTNIDYSAKRETVEGHFAYIGGRDDVWCASFNDVAAYITERKTTTVSYIGSTSGSLTLSAVSTVTDEGYDVPLTVKIEVPNGWTKATVSQGENQKVCKVFTENGRSYVYGDVVPNGENVVVYR